MGDPFYGNGAGVQMDLDFTEGFPPLSNLGRTWLPRCCDFRNPFEHLRGSFPGVCPQGPYGLRISSDGSLKS